MKHSEITHLKLRPLSKRDLPHHRKWVEDELSVSQFYPEDVAAKIREILEPLQRYDDQLTMPMLAIKVTRHQIEQVVTGSCGNRYRDIIARYVGIAGWARITKHGLNEEKEKAKVDRNKEASLVARRQRERQAAVKSPAQFFFADRPEFVDRVTRVVLDYENALIHLVCQERPWGKLGEEAFVDSASSCMDKVLGNKEIRSEKMDFLAIRRLVFLLFAWNFRAILPSDVVVKNARFIPRRYRAQTAGIRPTVLEKYSPKKDD